MKEVLQINTAFNQLEGKVRSLAWVSRECNATIQSPLPARAYV